MKTICSRNTWRLSGFQFINLGAVRGASEASDLIISEECYNRKSQL